MDWKSEYRKLFLLAGGFLAIFFLPLGLARFDNAITEALALAKWYAREHVLLCLIPAFFIAGAIGVFVSQASVMKYLGAKANKLLAYGVASVSGAILAVCSCTILPLFTGIYRMGAGLGPAVAFLYSGPAISVLAIILTARILGFELGLARAIGAISFSVIIGLVMHIIYRKEELQKAAAAADLPAPQVTRPLWQNAIFFAAMVGVLVFANWGKPADAEMNLALTIYNAKWIITSAMAGLLGLSLIFWFGLKWWKVLAAAIPPILLAIFLPTDGLMMAIPFTAAVIGLSIITSTDPGESSDWFAATWGFAKQITPLLFIGVLVAGFLLGRPDKEGLIPSEYVKMLVGQSPETFLTMTGLVGSGGESFIRAAWPIWTNFFASIFGAFMYFATLTEVPIVQGLIGSGMGKGPALALLLAGPSLSLPSMLVIRGVMGTRKTIVYASLVIVMSTIAGTIFGAICG